MSAYLSTDELCNPNRTVMLKNDLTGTVVYSFCRDHQLEYVHPMYAHNLSYFRQLREIILEYCDMSGQRPHVSLPNDRLTTQVCTTPEEVADYQMKLEAVNE